MLNNTLMLAFQQNGQTDGRTEQTTVKQYAPLSIRGHKNDDEKEATACKVRFRCFSEQYKSFTILIPASLTSSIFFKDISSLICIDIENSTFRTIRSRFLELICSSVRLFV